MDFASDAVALANAINAMARVVEPTTHLALAPITPRNVESVEVVENVTSAVAEVEFNH